MLWEGQTILVPSTSGADFDADFIKKMLTLCW
jgi:hypothetical protein